MREEAGEGQERAFATQEAAQSLPLDAWWLGRRTGHARVIGAGVMGQGMAAASLEGARAKRIW